MRAWHDAQRRALRRRVLLLLGLGRGQELGDDLDREHSGDPARRVDDRRVLGLATGAGRRARRAGRRRGRGPGPARCRARRERCRRAGRPPTASRAGAARSRRRAGTGPRRPRASPCTSAVDWPTWASGASQRSMSRTRISASRFSARSAPTKSSTKSSAGLISSSAGVAYWARMPPSSRTAIRSPIFIASSMSWVTKRIVLRISAWRRRNSFCSRSRLIGSIAPNGSSISITCGSAASARATPTRCCWPPESCDG